MSEPNDVQELIGTLNRLASNTMLKVDQSAMREAATTLAALSARIEGLERVLGNLVDQLGCLKSPTNAALYADELAAAKAALNSLPVKP